ncbi:MAG: acyltransferase [Colwellia sp.]|nr:acyltransferase [Colwellia sp.]
MCLVMKKILKNLLLSLKRRKLTKKCHFENSTLFGSKVKIRTHNKDQVLLGANVSFFANIDCSERAKVTIGNNSTVRYKTNIQAEQSIVIGNNVIISYNVIITDSNSHPTDVQSRDMMTNGDHNGELWSAKYAKSAPIVIEDSVWIGRNVMVLKGVTIGKGSIVAAGAVVTKNVPPYSLCYGNPAQVKSNAIAKKPEDIK